MSLLPNSVANLHNGVHASPTKLNNMGKLQRISHKGLVILHLPISCWVNVVSHEIRDDIRGMLQVKDVAEIAHAEHFPEVTHETCIGEVLG